MLAVVMFLAMLATLGVAVFAFRRGKPDAMLGALTLRVALSVLFFLLLMLAWYAGWIEPHGLGG